MMDLKLDLRTQARDLWNGVKTPISRTARVDFDGIFAELIRVANDERRKIGDRVFVPCDYVVSLSSRDYAEMRDGNFTGLMGTALQKALEEFIAGKKYQKQGAVAVKIREDEHLEDGFVQVTWSFTIPPNEATVLQGAEPADLTVLHATLAIGASLEVVQGDATQVGRRLDVTKLPAKLGRVTRSQSADIGLIDPSNGVGREHAVLSREGNRFRLEDTSLNGTWLNGVKLTKGEPAELVEGAEISLVKGVVVLRFHQGERSA